MAEKTVPNDKVPVRADRNQPAATRERDRFVRPAVDIFDNGEGLVLVCDLPGIRREDLRIDVNDDLLTIEAKRTAHERSRGAIYEEYRIPGYFRQFQLTDEVNVEKVSAELKNGVLMLLLPKAEKAKPKRIEVKVS